MMDASRAMLPMAPHAGEPPPSYEEATDKNPWRIIAPYLSPSSLYNVCLVSKQAYAGASQELWRDPARFLELKESHKSDAIAKLSNCFNEIPELSFRPRWSTKCLDLRPFSTDTFHDTISGEHLPELQWLSIFFSLLPDIRVLLMDDMQNLPRSMLEEMLHFPDPAIENTELRMLRCTTLHDNCVFENVLGIVPPASRLIYLDLSYHLLRLNEKIHRLFAENCSLRYIGVLKLRNIRLQDDDLIAICRQLSATLWSLDVRDNVLTEWGMLQVLKSFGPPIPAAFPRQTGITEDREDHVRDQVSAGYSSCEHKDTGITHLYISGNRFTPTLVKALLKAGRLIVLEIGLFHHVPLHLCLIWEIGFPALIPPEYLSFLPELKPSVSPHLLSFGVHHTFVTGNSWVKDYEGRLSTLEFYKIFPLKTEHVDASQYYDPTRENPITRDPSILDFVAQTGLKELVLLHVPYQSRAGFVNRGLFAFINHLGEFEQVVGRPTSIRTVKLVVESTDCERKYHLEDTALIDLIELQQMQYQLWRTNGYETITSVPNPWKKGFTKWVLKDVAKECNWSGKVIIENAGDFFYYDSDHDVHRDEIQSTW